MLQFKKRIAFLFMMIFCGSLGYAATELINYLNCSFFISCIILIITFYTSNWFGGKFKYIKELIEDDHLIKYGKDE